MVLSPAEDRSPWSKFLHFLPAPFSHLASNVGGNALALAAAAFLITHWSRETQTSAQLSPLSFPFPFENLLYFSLPWPSETSSFRVIHIISAPEQFLSQGNPGLRGVSSTSRMLSPVLLQVGAQRSKRPGKEGTGCQPWCIGPAVSLLGGRATPCSGESPSGTGWPHLEGAPPSPHHDPGHHLDFGSSSCLRWLFPALCQTELLSSPVI